jgi:hypothetical protein
MVWAYFRALPIGRARTALDTSRGIGLAFGSEEAGRIAFEKAYDEAFPPAR